MPTGANNSGIKDVTVTKDEPSSANSPNLLVRVGRPKPSLVHRLNALFQRAIDAASAEATFFRVHILAFTFVPLFASGVFYGCNGRFHISFLDSMFLCYSAMTVCGLSTINLSSTTPLQQAILYVLMLIGDITVVSWVMVLVRRNHFRTRCEYVVANRPRDRSKTLFIKSLADVASTPPPDAPHRSVNGTTVVNGSLPSDYPQVSITNATPGVTLLGFDATQQPESPISLRSSEYHARFDDIGTPNNPRQNESAVGPISDESGPEAVLGDNQGLTYSPQALSASLAPSSVYETRSLDAAMSTSVDARRRFTTIREGVPYPRRGTTIIARHPTNPAVPGSPASKKYEGYGGFPGVANFATSALKIAMPETYRKVQRQLTLPQTQTIEAQNTPWLDFDLVSGRNSDFHTEELTDEQVEAIGGAEYRALVWLSWLVPLYFVGTQIISYLIFAPWLATISQYDSVFEAQFRLVAKPWFSLFQVMGAYTGGGLSLVDLGMVPFMQAYLMIFSLAFVILAGNHALPIFLRFAIWILSRIVPKDSESDKALSFLLDHPRRCFIYLFPSHQTWFLVIILLSFSAMEWVAFEVLSIGLDAFDTLPRGARIVAGLFQGLAARASGFAIVPLSPLAPALQFLYVVMMYIAVYPVAMSIHSTNVYEERSLGVFEEPPDEEDEEPADGVMEKFNRRERIGRYMNWHFRRQLSIDIWWLVWAVFVIAIIERDNLLDEEKKWFDMFRVLFELVSAFSGIGLSLGFPSDNFSFVGAMHPLSKLVVIVIMVRGRHRGLPVAIDRAVLLPKELESRKLGANKGNTDVTQRAPGYQIPEAPVGENGV
ncbi:TrkH-domain-containing protein [Pluteus cervinus]|uniref:TrkH-domain-containing protein n=1 Tax=Pluteus cervinus TaxID=181527 RepID=A0ACD3AC17_9AGAR|nr:TrkH-domain-containing protein [Pluteus cervinus]